MRKESHKIRLIKGSAYLNDCKMKDLFIVHPSVFHDAFRSDYSTPYRQSSKDFFQMLFQNYLSTGTKIGHTSGEAFFKLLEHGSFKESSIIWTIPESIVEIDFKTYGSQKIPLKIDKSIVKLASRKCIISTPYIVTTKKEIDQEGATFTVVTPKDAIKIKNQEYSKF